MKTKRIMFVLGILILCLPISFAAGNFTIQNTTGTDLFHLDSATGILNITSGSIAEGGTLLSDLYCALGGCTMTGALDLSAGSIVLGNDAISEAEIDFDTSCGAGNHLYISGNDLACEPDATGGNTTEEIQDVVGSMLGGTETHITVTYQDASDNIDFVVSDDWWDALTDMVLTDSYIYVGDGDNDPVGVAVSGDIAMANTGAVTIQANAVEESMLKAVDTASDEQVLTYEATTGDFEWHWFNESITAGTGLTWSGETINLDNDFGADISEDELANTDFGDFSCDGTDQGCSLDATYLENVVEDTTPQLGGNLDVNSKNITGGGSDIIMGATGNVVIKLG